MYTYTRTYIKYNGENHSIRGAKFDHLQLHVPTTNKKDKASTSDDKIHKTRNIKHKKNIKTVPITIKSKMLWPGERGGGPAARHLPVGDHLQQESSRHVRRQSTQCTV